MIYKFGTNTTILEIENDLESEITSFIIGDIELPSYLGEKIELNKYQLFELIGALLSIQSKINKIKS